MEEELIWISGELLATSVYLALLIVCVEGIMQVPFDKPGLPVLRLCLLGKNGTGMGGAGTMHGFGEMT